jgi:hypothetical protein
MTKLQARKQEEGHGNKVAMAVMESAAAALKWNQISPVNELATGRKCSVARNTSQSLQYPSVTEVEIHAFYAFCRRGIDPVEEKESISIQRGVKSHAEITMTKTASPDKYGFQPIRSETPIGKANKA